MNPQNVITDQKTQLMVLYGGRRGLKGDQGDPGEEGPQGFSIRPLGAWSSGTTYRPGDSVTADSTAVEGVKSLFVQRDGTPESVSTTTPRDDPGRWLEVGAVDLSNVTGAIWKVHQIAHGFTAVGTPVGYSESADRWVKANNRAADDPAVAVVRDVLSADEVVLQSSGEINDLDPAIIEPAAAEFEEGRFYFVDRFHGKVSLTQTTESVNFAANAILLATGPTSGVVLPWQQTPNIVGRREVGYYKFYYDAAAGQTEFSGLDLDGNSLLYTVTDQTKVFLNGANLSSFDQFTADTGNSVTVPSATEGDRVEIWAPSAPLTAIAPATGLMADDISSLFDGVETDFNLTVNSGAPVLLSPAQNVLVWLDGTAQEPLFDYEIKDDGAGNSVLVFTSPPLPGTRFWAVVGVAIGNLAALDVETLTAETLTVTSHTQTQSLAVVNDAGVQGDLGVQGQTTTNTLDVVDSASVGNGLDVTGGLAADNATVSGEAEADTLRGASLGGPSEGGQIVASNLTVDGGTF